VRVERIVSRGHCSGADAWYDQDGDEWVLVVQGHARLEVAGETDLVEMKAGDWVILPAHVRHRVAWTDPLVDTVWLAVHYAGEAGS
jgi:cupin 2 domain-containing protein